MCAASVPRGHLFLAKPFRSDGSSQDNWQILVSEGQRHDIVVEPGPQFKISNVRMRTGLTHGGFPDGSAQWVEK